MDSKPITTETSQTPGNCERIYSAGTRTGQIVVTTQHRTYQDRPAFTRDADALFRDSEEVREAIHLSFLFEKVDPLDVTKRWTTKIQSRTTGNMLPIFATVYVRSLRDVRKNIRRNRF